MGDNKRKMPPPSSMVTRSRTRRQSSQSEDVVTSSPPLESRHSTTRRTRFTNPARYSRQARAPTRPLSIPGDRTVAAEDAAVKQGSNDNSNESSNDSTNDNNDKDDGRKATTITVTRLAQRLPSPHNRVKRIRVAEPKPEESDLESLSSDDDDDEALPTFTPYVSKHEEEEQHHEREDDSADVDLVSGRRLDVIAQNPDDALPVSELSDFDKLFMNTVNKQLSANISLLTNDDNNKPRWPKDKQDETMFSVLLNPDKRKATPPRPLSIPSLSSSPSSSALQSPAALSPTSDSLEDFVNYDSLLLDEQQSSGEESSSSSSSSPTSSSRSSPVNETVPSVPLCGYRNRNKTTIEAPANNKAFMAVLSSMADGVSTMSATALYQQALIAASGLNRRSLWSGKAREMVSGDLEW